MKRRKYIALLFCTAEIFLPSLTAHGQQQGFYFKTDLGGAFTQDADLKVRFPKIIAQEIGIVSAARTVRFDSGARLGMAAGYQITEWIAAEAELGAFVNTIRQGDTSEVFGRLGVRDSTYANVPLLFNVRLQYPNQSRWSPYIGGGLGVSAAILDLMAYASNMTQDTFVGVRTTDATAVFAYQGFAGLRYRLSDHTGLSLDYRYFVAQRPGWDDDYGSRITFSATQTHALSVAFDWSF